MTPINEDFKGKGNSKQNSLKKELNKTKSNKDLKPNKQLELDIPPIPEIPKKKDKLTVNSPGLSTDLLEKIKKLKSKDNEVVLVNCERCKTVIPVPIPRTVILNSELPIVPISYVHKNSMGKDIHCITVHLDHDFDIRRQRISDVVISSD